VPFLIDDDTRSQSGVGLAGGLSAFRKLKLGDTGASLSFVGTADIRKYLNASFDEARFSTSASWLARLGLPRPPLHDIAVAFVAHFARHRCRMHGHLPDVDHNDLIISVGADKE